MAGSFNTKKTPDSMYATIKGIAKKVFFIALFLYFCIQILEQFHLTTITRFFDKTVLLGHILAGFIFMITFSDRESKQARISRSDWALIGLFATIAFGLNLIILSDLGIVGNIASVVLLFFAIGLVLYVWSGSDENVRFSLFKRDRRYKFGTYIRSTAAEWITAGVALALFLTISYTVSGEITDSPTVITANPTQPVPSVTQNPTPTIAEPSQAPTITLEPTPTLAPTPIPASSLPSDYTVYVLNGSGVSGVANDIRTLLQENGISVHYAGDASTFDHTETLVLFNPEYETLATAIHQILEDHYEPIQKRQFNLGERYSQYNLVVIHGQ